jgi:hypothetical protein
MLHSLSLGSAKEANTDGNKKKKQKVETVAAAPAPAPIVGKDSRILF